MKFESGILLNRRVAAGGVKGRLRIHRATGKKKTRSALERVFQEQLDYYPGFVNDLLRLTSTI